jgi:medium-chain acyl-[acyl-carrier-protein] hydrolase
MREQAADPWSLLVCLPYAGGSASTYRSWPAALADVATVHPMTLPGHADRWNLPLAEDLHGLADHLTAELGVGPGGSAGASLDPRTYGQIVLFGYSLGALLAFEMVRRLADWNLRPAALMVAACAPPASPLHRRRMHQLPDAEFLDWIRQLDATPEAILADPEMMTILLPVLRNDVALSERYGYREAAPLPIPIVTLAGHADPYADPSVMAGWAAESTLPVREVTVPGGHMFIHEQEAAVLDVVRDTLTGRGAMTGKAD